MLDAHQLGVGTLPAESEKLTALYARNAVEARTYCSLLLEAGIPAVISERKATSRGTPLLVPRDQFDRAGEVIAWHEAGVQAAWDDDDDGDDFEEDDDDFPDDDDDSLDDDYDDDDDDDEDDFDDDMDDD